MPAPAAVRARLASSLRVAGLGGGGLPRGGEARRGESSSPACPSPRPDPRGDSLSASGITWERGGAAPAPVPSLLPVRDCSGPAPRRIAGPGKLKPRRTAPSSPSPGTRGAGGEPSPAGALRAAGDGQRGAGTAPPPRQARERVCRDRAPRRAAVGAHGVGRAAGPPQPGAALHRREGQFPGWGQVIMGILPPSQPQRSLTHSVQLTRALLVGCRRQVLR